MSPPLPWALLALGMREPSPMLTTNRGRGPMATRPIFIRSGKEGLGLSPDLFDGPRHKECLLRQVVALPLDDLLEPPHRVRHLDIAARNAGELPGYEKE